LLNIIVPNRTAPNIFVAMTYPGFSYLRPVQIYAEQGKILLDLWQVFTMVFVELPLINRNSETSAVVI